MMRNRKATSVFLSAMALVFAVVIFMGRGKAFAETKYVAMIGGTSYETLAKAVEAAGTHRAVIRLIDDTTEGVVIPAGADITIDLKGHTINNRNADNPEGGPHTFENYGKLELLSSGGAGVIDNVTHAKACVMNQPGATAVISGDLCLTRSNLPLPDNATRGSWYNICNRGTMTVNEDVSVINNDARHTAVTTGFLDVELLFPDPPEAKLTVNGGYFTGKLNAFKVDSAGVLEINDGKIENTSGVAIVSWNILKINGGTINAATPFNLNRYSWEGKVDNPPSSPTEKGITEINGGTFTCGQDQTMFTKSNSSIGGAVVTINDGTFTGSFSSLQTMGANTDGEPYVFCRVNGGRYFPDPSEYVEMPRDKETVTEEDGYVTLRDHDWQEADCTRPKYCKHCGEIDGDALGHDFRYAGMTWAEDNSAKANFVCKHDEQHTHQVVATVTPKTYGGSVCEPDRVTVYTAVAAFGDVEYKDTKEVGLHSENHSWNEPTYTWSEDYTLCVAMTTCANCGIKEVETAVVEESDISEDPAECENHGERTFVAKFPDHEVFKDQTATEGIDPTGHTHGDWEYKDDTHHHKLCTTCGDPVEEEEHKWSEGPVTSKPTCTETGSQKLVCTVCGADDVKTIDKVDEHDYRYAGMTWAEDNSAKANFVCRHDKTHTHQVAATVTSNTYGSSVCEPNRVTVYTAVVTIDGVDYKDTKEVGLHSENHSWNVPTYTWSKDNRMCVAKTTCANCGIKEVETAVVEESDISEDPAECEEYGERKFEARFPDHEVFKNQTVTESIDPTGHTHGDWEHKNDTHHHKLCSVCEKPVAEEEHDWDAGVVTKKATQTATGVRTLTCKTCDATKEEKIDKLQGGSQAGSDGTAVGPGASAAAADRAITSLPDDVDPQGSVFGILRLKSPKQTKSSVRIAWKQAGGAAKYIVYGNACGKRNKMKQLATVTGRKMNFKQVAGKKVKKGTYYKFMVVALDKNDKVVSTSKMIHVATKGGKVGNHRKVTVKAKAGKKVKAVSRIKLKKGKKLKLKTTLTPVSKKLKVRKHVGVRYESSNPGVATVTSKGKITARGKGKCSIYVYAQNGAYKIVKTTIR